MAVKFRERAREKLSAAENFDAPVPSVAPHWWLAACGGLLSIAAFLIWAVFGEIPQITEGTGIYHREAGEAFCFVPLDEKSGIEDRMQVRFQEEGSSKPTVNGYIQAEEEVWLSEEEMLTYVNGSDVLLKYLTEGNPTAVYRCVLEDMSDLEDGAVFQVEIQRESVHPIELWL